jgi:hypothetical protein
MVFCFVHAEDLLGFKNPAGLESEKILPGL